MYTTSLTLKVFSEWRLSLTTKLHMNREMNRYYSDLSFHIIAWSMIRSNDRKFQFIHIDGSVVLIMQYRDRLTTK